MAKLSQEMELQVFLKKQRGRPPPVEKWLLRKALTVAWCRTDVRTCVYLSVCCLRKHYGWQWGKE